MATILRMPEVAANATHATLVQWVRAEGDCISLGESIAEIETDKAVIEIGAQGEGILAKILVKAGTDVAVGAAIAVLLAPGESLDAAQGLLGQTTERVPQGPVSFQRIPLLGKSRQRQSQRQLQPQCSRMRRSRVAAYFQAPSPACLPGSTALTWLVYADRGRTAAWSSMT